MTEPGDTHTEEILTEETTQQQNNSTSEQETPEQEEFEKAFDEFANSKTEHEIPDGENENQQNQEFIPDGKDLNATEQFKLVIFTGLFFTLVDGFHAFAFSFFSKYKITSAEISLSETEQGGLDIYFRQSKKIMDFINKLSPELIGIIHMEYMYFQKFREIQEQHELRAALEKPEEKEEEEEEEEEKPVRKKKKKKKVRKKPIVKPEKTTENTTTQTAEETKKAGE